MTPKQRRELLELAAKAAGIEAVRSPDGLLRDCTGFHPLQNVFSATTWNPIYDDGDALRLAVRLNLDVCFGANYVIVRGSVQMPLVNNANDPYAATRLAIVRAAAEIGRRMKEASHA